MPIPLCMRTYSSQQLSIVFHDILVMNVHENVLSYIHCCTHDNVVVHGKTSKHMSYQLLLSNKETKIVFLKIVLIYMENGTHNIGVETTRSYFKIFTYKLSSCHRLVTNSHLFFYHYFFSSYDRKYACEGGGPRAQLGCGLSSHVGGIKCQTHACTHVSSHTRSRTNVGRLLNFQNQTLLRLSTFDGGSNQCCLNTKPFSPNMAQSCLIYPNSFVPKGLG